MRQTKDKQRDADKWHRETAICPHLKNEKCRSRRNHRSKQTDCGRPLRRPQAENQQASNLSENWNHTRTLSGASARRKHSHARCPAATHLATRDSARCHKDWTCACHLGEGGRDGRRGPVRRRSRPRAQPREKLPSVRDRPKTTNISRSGDSETSQRGMEADTKI